MIRSRKPRGAATTRALAAPLVLALALAPLAAMAQTAPAPQQAPAAAPLAPLPAASHLQAARDLVIVSGVSGPFSNIYNDFVTNMRQNFITRPEVKKDLDAVLGALKVEADKRVEDMVATAALVFARNLSEAELKEITGFFNSPVGRKYNELRPQMITQIYQQLEPWTFRTSDFFYRYTRDEMKKRGHDIAG